MFLPWSVGSWRAVLPSWSLTSDLALGVPSESWRALSQRQSTNLSLHEKMNWPSAARSFWPRTNKETKKQRQNSPTFCPKAQESSLPSKCAPVLHHLLSATTPSICTNRSDSRAWNILPRSPQNCRGETSFSSPGFPKWRQKPSCPSTSGAGCANETVHQDPV